MNSTQCDKCKRFITNNNFKKHFSSCDGTIKRTNGHCEHCGKDFSIYGIGLHVWRAHTKEGVAFSKNLIENINTGRPGWNKGLTKYTDNRLKKTSETTLKNNLLGLIKRVPHRWTEDEKKIKSQQRKDFLTKNPDKHPFIIAHHSKGPSYPEKYFEELLIKNNIDFQKEFRVGTYSLDFLINGNIDLEIDGNQHYYMDTIIESDKRRTSYLEANGFKVIRVCWAKYKSLTNTEKEKFIKKLLLSFLEK